MQQIFWWLHCCILLTNRILNRLAPLFCFSSVALQTISISFDWMWSTGLDISYPFRMWQFAKLIVSFGLMIGQRFVRNLNKQWMETRVITKRMMKWRAVLLIRRQMDGVVWNVLWLVELRKFEFLYIDWFWNRCRVTSPSVAMQLEFKVFFFSPLTMPEIVWSSILWCLMDRSFNCLLGILKEKKRNAYAISFQHFGFKFCFDSIEAEREWNKATVWLIVRMSHGTHLKFW